MSIAKAFGLLALSFLASFAGAMDLSVIDVQSCDQYGNAAQNQLSQDYYYFRVDFTVQNANSTPYTIRFQYADETYEYQVQTPFNGTYYYYVGMWSGYLDGTLPIQATLDPYNQTNDSNRSDNSKTGTLTPTPLNSAITYLSPKRYVAWQSTVVHFSGQGNLTRAVSWAYAPVSMEHQTVLRNVVPTGSQVIYTSPFNLPVYQTDTANPPYGPVGFQQSAYVDLRRTFVNAGLLRGATWAQVDAAAQQMTPWVSPEDIIQSNDPVIATYVTQQLGTNYRQTMTPYDAALTLYKAEVRDMSYSADNPGNSAVEALNNLEGDCGGMSMVFVACMRHIGIPSRTISGWWSGVDQWHVKSEVFMPPYGWVSQDTSECDLECPSGAYPYYFGNDGSLDQFFVVNRAQTHIYNGLSIDAAFQPGTVWWWGTWSDYYWSEDCSLTRINSLPNPTPVHPTH